MGRIRTIKPEFPQSESMGRVSRDARLLFVMLWTLVDDSGRTRAASRMLASLLFPYDDDAASLIGGWLDELEQQQCIVRYEVDGDSYLEVCKWGIHQRIDRPSPSKFPPFDEASRIIAKPRERSTLDRDLDQGPRTEDQGSTPPPPKGGESPSGRRRTPTCPKPDDVSQSTWDDWVAHRKSKRASVTAGVIATLRKQLPAGWTAEQGLAFWTMSGNQGFFPPKDSGTGTTVSPSRKGRYTAAEQVEIDRLNKLYDEEWK